MTQESGVPVELRLRAAVESSPSGLLMIDAQGTIVLVNREVERLFGYPREELLGKSVDVLVPDRLRKSHPKHRSDFFASPRGRAMGAGRDLFGQRKDGSEVPVEIGLTPVATDEGLFVLSSIVDISERKRAELRFRAAVESSPNGMLMIDSSGQIVLVNREIERMFGYEREQLLEQSVEILVPDRFRLKHPEYRTSFFHDPQERSMGAGRDLYGLRRDDVEFPVEIGLNPIQTDEGMFILSSVVDISSRKRAEEDQKRLEEQLLQAQKMEAVGTLAGGIAHDFNNLLGAIVGYTELALNDVSDRPSAVSDLNEVLMAAKRGKQLIARILTFSRRHEPARRPLDLPQVVVEAIKLLRATMPANIAIETNASPATPLIAADHTSMHQVVMNLVSNSAHAMPDGGQIEIEIDPVYVRDSMAQAHPDLREGPYAVLAVRDTGTGIAPNVKDRVFEPFFTTKPAGSGSGLGLAMVHGIMRDHEGAVILESKVGKGTQVRCFFPATSAETDDPLPAKISTARAHERILYVEDEVPLTQVGKRRLEQIGYTVTTAPNGERALEVFRDSRDEYDVIVTDYLMPGMNGLDLARAVVKIRHDIPIILLTGFIEDLPAEEVSAAGIRHCIKKPVTTQELAEALRFVLAD